MLHFICRSSLPGTFTGTVALNNDYIFRGISQTDHNPAIQGSINYTLDTGFYGTSVYGGVWGSNLDFNDDVRPPTIMARIWSSTGRSVSPATSSIPASAIRWAPIYYDYPGARSGLSYNYWEFAPALTYAINDWLSLSGGLNYSPDYFGGSGEGFYPNGGVTVKIPGPEQLVRSLDCSA